MSNEASITRHITDSFENIRVANTDELEEVLRPIDSLISKSEKAQQKLAQGTWQHKMLQDNLKALRIASALLKRKLTIRIVSRGMI
jgi:hypothetical protein